MPNKTEKSLESIYKQYYELGRNYDQSCENADKEYMYMHKDKFGHITYGEVRMSGNMETSKIKGFLKMPKSGL